MFDYGQPEGSICQISFVVEDVHAAMEKYVKAMNVGPWFYIENPVLKNVLYRGKPSQINGCLATAYSGGMMIELIQQKDDAPSIFTEVIQQRGYGLHHYGIAVRDYDSALKKYEDMGYEVAFYIENDLPHRAAYLDTKGEFPFFIELLEATPGLEAIFSKVHEASVGWDGSNPVRNLQSYTDTSPFA